MKNESSTLTIGDTIAEITMHFGKCNEIGTELLKSLETQFETVSKSDAKVLILTSSQPSGFSAGADLKELHEHIQTMHESDIEQELRDFLNRVHTLFNNIDSWNGVVIGAIEGVCFGGGFELALTCDLLIADPSVRFAFPELRLGIIPGFGGIPRLRRDIGQSIIRDLIFSGRTINAQKAHQIGLISQLTGKGKALKAARSLARHLTRFDAATIYETKHFIKNIPYEELKLEQETFLRMFQRPVVREALAAFYTRNDPQPYLPESQ